MSTFTANYNVTGSDRKELVNLVAETIGSPAKYQGAPSFAYTVDYITIDRNQDYSGDPSGKTITLSFKAYTPDGDREISGASECIDQVYHFYL